VQKYRIEYSKSAEKFILSRTQKERERILNAIEELPYCCGVKKMQGYSVRYRLRIGSIRVIYDKFDNVLKIYVVDIGNRGDVYK